MTSYILKNKNLDKDILLFEEKEEYTFKPKKNFKNIKSVTILDTEMLNKIWENKLNKEYQKLVKLTYLLLKDEDESSDALAVYTEINRIKEYLLSLKEKGLSKNIIDNYLKKILIIEHELNKLEVLEEEKIKGR